MVALSGVTQGKKETLRAYFDWFTKVVVAIEGTNESLQCLIFEKGLWPDNTFWEKLGHKEAYNLKDLLSRAQSYIDYEDKLLTDGGNRGLRIPGVNRVTRKIFREI